MREIKLVCPFGTALLRLSIPVSDHLLQCLRPLIVVLLMFTCSENFSSLLRVCIYPSCALGKGLDSRSRVRRPTMGALP